MRRGLALALTLLAFPAAASAATPWLGLQPVSASRPAGGFGPMGGFTANDLAVNASGAAVAAWIDGTGKAVASRRAAGGGWEAPRTVSDPAVTALGGVSVAIDAAGDVTVAWASSTAFFSTTAPAGGDFGPQQTILGGQMLAQTVSIDLAMNAAGATVVAFSANNTASPAYAASAATAGGAWSAPKLLAAIGNSAGAAINEAGQAVASAASTVPKTGGGTKVVPVGAFKAANGLFGDPAVALDEDVPYARPIPVIDPTGRAAVMVRTGTGDVVVVPRAAANNNFTVVGVGDKPITGCGGSETSEAMDVDGSGTITVAYSCGGDLYTGTRTATGSFGSPQPVKAIAASPTLALDVTPTGLTLLAVQVDGTTAAYRRASATAAFGTAEAFVDPDEATALEAAALDDHGDGIALLGKSANPVGADEYSSVLDLSPPTAAIGGPDAVSTGDLTTYTFTGQDPFGGFPGPAAWTLSDGGTGSGDTFQRTFTVPGTYVLSVARKDFGGTTATAAKTITVAVPTPTASPSPTPTATPTVTASPTPTPTPPVTRCVVPKLKGKTLAAARKALKKAHCKLGKVKKPKHGGKQLRVKKQSAKAKRKLKKNAKVGVTLAMKKIG